jgi:hypothetical protein
MHNIPIDGEGEGRLDAPWAAQKGPPHDLSSKRRLIQLRRGMSEAVRQRGRARKGMLLTGQDAETGQSGAKRPCLA